MVTEARLAFAAPTGLTWIENQITGCDVGIESQWASTIALNTFRQTKSMRICTGSYSPGASSRIWRNSNDGTGVDALAACDIAA